MSKNSLRQWVKSIERAHLRRAALGLVLLSVVLVSACRQDMQDQPKFIPMRPSKFFANGSSARLLVEGTVPRGYLRENKALYTGKKEGAPAAPAPAPAPASGAPVVGAALYPDMVTEMPVSVNKELIERGQQRFQIFCSACHGLTGNGDGMIWRRGYKKPATLHTDQLRQVPVGHLFDVITNGWIAMPAYADQIPVQDRWAIVAYIRALQLTQPSTAPAAPSASPAASPAPSATNTPATRPAAPAKNGGR